MDWLKELKVGDKVIKSKEIKFYGGSRTLLSLGCVKEVSGGLAYVDSNIFGYSLKTGFIDTSANKSKIIKFTPELEQKVKEQEEHTNLYKALNEFNFIRLDLDKLKQINKVVYKWWKLQAKK